MSSLAALGVPPERGAIYELALKHRSYAFEREDHTGHNERLEFLGDSVLGLIVSELIFRRHPELAEGEMARLRAQIVNTSALADLARDLDLGDDVLLGKGEEMSGGRDKDSILANTFEAVVGAVFIDRGIEVARAALTLLLETRVDTALAEPHRFDSKNALQEAAVRVTGLLPRYRVASSGPDHEKQFEASVYIGDELRGTGSGRSKKEAEQNAARAALETFGVREESDARAS